MLVLLHLIILCIYGPGCSIWFCLVYSLLPGVPVCVSLALSCTALFVYIKDYYLSLLLVCVFLYPPRVCTVTVLLTHIGPVYTWSLHAFSLMSIWFVETFPFTLGHINVSLQNGYKSILQLPPYANFTSMKEIHRCCILFILRLAMQTPLIWL